MIETGFYGRRWGKNIPHTLLSKVVGNVPCMCVYQRSFIGYNLAREVTQRQKKKRQWSGFRTWQKPKKALSENQLTFAEHHFVWLINRQVWKWLWAMQHFCLLHSVHSHTADKLMPQPPTRQRCFSTCSPAVSGAEESPSYPCHTDNINYVWENTICRYLLFGWTGWKLMLRSQ